MQYYIVIREQNQNDTPKISELVRKAYISNVTNSFITALFHETTYQLIILITALLFICLQIPITYCLLSIPIVLLSIYVTIYINLTMKAAQLTYEKKPIKCWIAEVYEPLFHTKAAEDCLYKIIDEETFLSNNIQPEGRRKIVGTVAVMKHKQKDDCAWLFRLAVDQSYRRKGIGLMLVETVKDWCRTNRYYNVELTMTECQTGTRQLFNKCGFDMKQLYHKQYLSNAYTLQMFQLRCEILSTF